MKVGLLVECGRQGLEAVVCTRICELLRERRDVKFEIDIVPMDNKARLIQECGTTAALLLGNGCDRVVILWDERPAWPTVGDKLCWHRDRVDILANLHEAKAQAAKVHLVCIEREFESWLLHDKRMLACMFSTVEHPIPVKPPRHPDRLPNPKGTMTRLFRKHGRGTYVDVQHAKQFTRCLADLNGLRRCDTFRRFAEKVTGRAI